MSAPVVINPQLIGNWRGALASDTAVSGHLNGNSLSSTDYSAALQAFQNAPATGCATIINQVRVAQGYNPLDPAQAGNRAAYNNWIDGVIQSGLFSIGYRNTVPLAGSNNWQSFVAQIIQMYVGITSADAARIQQSIMVLVQAAYTMPGKPETVQMIQQTISANQDGSVSAYFYYTAVSIVYTAGDKNSSSVLSSTFIIDQVKLDMALATWTSKAAEVAAKQVSLVSSWLGNMAPQAMATRSSANNDRASNNLSCFRPVPGTTDARVNGNANDYWFAFDWRQLPEDARTALETLGWTAKNWMTPFNTPPSVMQVKWKELPEVVRKAAKVLTYTQLLWEGPGVLKGIHSGDVEAYWHAFSWSEMAPVFQAKWQELGWDEAKWADKSSSAVKQSWAGLNDAQKRAASWLGLTTNNFQP